MRMQRKGAGQCPTIRMFDVVGIATTGMYFNPAMATGHLLGCKGATDQDHLIVYWLGPFIGCIIAMLFDRVLHIDVTSTKKDNSEKKKQ